MEKQFSIDNNQLMIKHQIDNEQKKIHNKISIVNSFATTMEMLNPQWRDDKRLVLQAKDYLKKGIFNGSSALQLENDRYLVLCARALHQPRHLIYEGRERATERIKNTQVCHIYIYIYA